MTIDNSTVLPLSSHSIIIPFLVGLNGLTLSGRDSIFMKSRMKKLSISISGLFLFLVEVAILCWVKFWDYSFTAAVAATVIVIPVLITFVLFAMHFYHSLVVYKCDTSIKDMENLESMKKQLDHVTTTV